MSPVVRLCCLCNGCFLPVINPSFSACRVLKWKGETTSSWFWAGTTKQIRNGHTLALKSVLLYRSPFLCTKQSFGSDLELLGQSDQGAGCSGCSTGCCPCLLDLSTLHFWARVWVFFFPFRAFNMKYSVISVCSTTIQVSENSVSGSEHILHLWLLCICVFSQTFSLPECDFGVSGEMLCLPAELAWAEGHISPEFLG